VASLLALLIGLLFPAPAPADAVRADLGSVKKINRVSVLGKGLGAARIQVSARGRRFTTVARPRRGARKRARARFAARRVRYVRIAGVKRVTRLRIRVDLVRGKRGRRGLRPPARFPVPEPVPSEPDGGDASFPPQAAAYRRGILPSPLPQSSGARRYVSTHGSDSAPGTESQPWRSIQHALEEARPGELVLVRGGVYAGEDGAGPDRRDGFGPYVYASPRGEPGAPITIRPHPGERAVIKGFVTLPSAQWFRMSGFVIDGAGASPRAEGVSLGNTSRAEPSHVELSYNEIKNFGSPDGHAHGILHFSGTDTALIGNRIHHIGHQTFYDHGIYLKDGRRVVVANNVVWSITGGYGLHIWGDLDDSWVLNNTVFGSAASGFTIGGNSERGHPDRVVTANNILAGQSGRSESQQGYAAVEYQPGNGNSVRHNLAWANARSAPFALSESGPAANATRDPRFVDVGRRDFRLATGSPAVDSAEDFGLLLDAAGRSRDARPDVGALEQVGAGVSRVRRTRSAPRSRCLLVKSAARRSGQRATGLGARCRIRLG
jgi:hypothetical protein